MQNTYRMPVGRYRIVAFHSPSHRRIATFYALLKIHKGLHPLKGRPIVSEVDSLSQNIGTYIEVKLSPCVETLPSFVKDTTNLLKRLEATNLLKRLEGVMVEKGSFLNSIDVEALYSSIPHQRGIKAV